MKNKLLFINGHMNSGGVEMSLLNVLKHIDYNKYDIDLLLLEDVGDYEKYIPDEVNIKFINISNTFGSLITSVIKCIKERDLRSLRLKIIFTFSSRFGQKNIRFAKKIFTNNKEYDCAIAYRSGIATKILAYAVNCKKRITWWHHGEINVDVKEYEKLSYKMDSIVAVSRYCKDMLEDRMPLLKGKVKIIPNMIPKDEIIDKAKQGSEICKKNKWQIVSIGRLSKEKHFENVVKTAFELKKRKINFSWEIIGDGTERSSLEKLVDIYELENEVRFIGNVENPYPYLKSKDLLVHPSYVESQCLVVLEAMALNIPCIVTKSGGTCEYIEDGVNGLLAEKNHKSLTRKTIEIIENDNLYKKIKENSICPSIFEPQEVMSKIYDIIG